MRVGAVERAGGVVARAPRTGVGEPLGARGVPRFDPPQEPSPGCHDLVPAGARGPVELDLPQLVVQPPREIADATGVDAAVTQRGVRRRGHPRACAAVARQRPGVPAERADTAGTQELVGDHRPASPPVRVRNASSRTWSVSVVGATSTPFAPAPTTRAVVSIW